MPQVSRYLASAASKNLLGDSVVYFKSRLLYFFKICLLFSSYGGAYFSVHVFLLRKICNL